MFVSLFLWIHFVQAVGGSQMPANAPSTVRAVKGSCVIIPCDFGPANALSFWRIHPVWWWQKQGLTVASSLASGGMSRPVSSVYRGRSSIVGNPKGGQCSLLLEKVRASDAGAYRFREETFQGGRAISHAVTLEVISPPVPVMTVTVREWVTASCAVPFYCKGSRPYISWSHPVNMFNKRERWETVSSVEWRRVFTARFPLTAALFHKRLNCTVTYRGGGKATSSTFIR